MEKVDKGIKGTYKNANKLMIEYKSEIQSLIDVGEKTKVGLKEQD